MEIALYSEPALMRQSFHFVFCRFMMTWNPFFRPAGRNVDPENIRAGSVFHTVNDTIEQMIKRTCFFFRKRYAGTDCFGD